MLPIYFIYSTLVSIMIRQDSNQNLNQDNTLACYQDMQVSELLDYVLSEKPSYDVIVINDHRLLDVFPNKTQITEHLYVFCLAVLKATALDDIKNVISTYNVLRQKKRQLSSCQIVSIWLYRHFFVKTISYANPDANTIAIIEQWYVKHIELFPTSKFVDVGCGSGIFERLLYGNDIFSEIPGQLLIGIDLPCSEKTHNFGKKYWEITESSSYEVDPDDVFFVAWGWLSNDILEKYIDSGGKYVIILGESEGGCTNPHSDYFSGNCEWEVRTERVTGGDLVHDYLTFNVRKVF